MACKSWNDEWVARLYGELAPDEDRAANEHLEQCPDCRTTMERLSETRAALEASAPEVPYAPRVVVLRPRPIRSHAWAFLTGAACAAVVFGLGLLAAPLVMSGTAEIEGDLLQLHQRLAVLEEDPEAPLTRVELARSLGQFERRIDRERAEDLRYVVGSITDSEIRTGTWLNQTQEALQYLALQQDPRFREQ